MKERKILKKDINARLLYFLLLIPFFQVPYLYVTYPIFDKIYMAYLIISVIIISLMVLIKKKYSRIINYVVMLMLILFISSIYNGISLNSCFGLSLKVIGLSLLCDYGTKTDKNNFFAAFEFFLTLLLIINFITIIKYPTGMYMNSTGYIENWFLGYKNTHILYIIPCLLVSLLKSYCYDNKLHLRNYILFVLSFISTMLVNNSTGLIGLVIISPVLFLKKVTNYTKIFNIYNFILAHIILFVSIIILHAQNLFSFLIVDILHKDLTFTGRVFIWEKAIRLINKKTLLGYGNVSFEYNKYIYSTHNMILGILHKIGIIGLIMFCILFFVVVKKIYKERNNKICQMISFTLFAYLIMMLTEYYNFEYFIYILVIANNIEYYIKEEGNG